jgi:uncharacterized protein
MLVVISPSKTMDKVLPQKVELSKLIFTSPCFQKEANKIMSSMKQMSITTLMEVMSISEKIAIQLKERIQSFSSKKNTGHAAVLSYTGEVYIGLGVQDFDNNDLLFAQDHLCILSGLYGVLRPLDAILPYRLEMGTKLKVSNQSLYKFWGEQIGKHISSELINVNSNCLINLASEEYYSTIRNVIDDKKVIHINFKIWKNNKWVVISFESKKARGMMANYIIKNKVVDPQKLKNINMDGYTYNKTLSNNNDWYFTK